MPKETHIAARNARGEEFLYHENPYPPANVANWEMLKAIAKTGEAESPSLKRSGEKFRAALAARQKRNLARIMARPGSVAYRDYVETPARRP